jgi:hypothetical protein
MTGDSTTAIWRYEVAWALSACTRLTIHARRHRPLAARSGIRSNAWLTLISDSVLLSADGERKQLDGPTTRG